jgi:ubiquinone biosynthesis protein
MSEACGTKVTIAAAHLPPKRRKQVAAQVVEVLVAIPMFAAQENAVFHGDPHAGNLFYDNRASELTIIDWSLRECLSRDERRHLALLFLMVALRDPVATCGEVLALTQPRLRRGSTRARLIADVVRDFLDKIPAAQSPSGVDAMRLLERIALTGIKFPRSLIMLSKVLFTLDGVVSDIAGPDMSMGFTLTRRVAQQWLTNRKAFTSPLGGRDWIALQLSSLLYPGRLLVRWEQSVLDRILSAGSEPSRASS